MWPFSKKKERLVTITIKEVGNSKVNVIKEVRRLTGLGLKESKHIVDNSPHSVIENVSLSKAKAFRDYIHGWSSESRVTLS